MIALQGVLDVAKRSGYSSVLRQRQIKEQRRKLLKRHACVNAKTISHVTGRVSFGLCAHAPFCSNIVVRLMQSLGEICGRQTPIAILINQRGF